MDNDFNDGVMEKLLNTYSNIPEKVWILGFSGGKDSSLLVDSAVEYMYKSGRDLSLHVVYSDTLLEYPLVREYAYTYLDELRKYGERTGLDVNVYTVKPEIGRDFISLQLVKRYPMPHRRFRWCTVKLKIEPARRIVSRIIKEHGSWNVALLNGARLDESRHRLKIMKKRINQCRDCIDPVSGLTMRYTMRILGKKTGIEFSEALPLYVAWSNRFNARLRVYSPLAYLGEEDVWHILRIRKKPFFTDKPLYDKLLTLYGLSRGNNTTKVRFGCWLCTVVKRDKSGEYFAEITHGRQRRGVEILRWARKTLFAISHGANEWFRREGRFPRQRYDGLNDLGVELTRAIYHIVYRLYPEAFQSYIEDKSYHKHLYSLIGEIDYAEIRRMINDLLEEDLDRNVIEALESLREYIDQLEEESRRWINH